MKLVGPVLFILLFLIAEIGNARTLLVITDETRDLNYFFNGEQHRFQKDLREMRKQFDEHQLVLVRIKKNSRNLLSGTIKLSGPIKKIRRFRKVHNLSSAYMRYIDKDTDLLYMGHTPSIELLKKILPLRGFRFKTIISSACKTAELKKMSLIKEYTDYLLASPENVHLAHFDLNHFEETLHLDPEERLLELSGQSFSRLQSFSKSNVVLNLYDLRHFSPRICEEDAPLSSFLLNQEIKLSRFEKKNFDSMEFIIKGCRK